MNKQIDNLFNKEMSRKEFLATIGLGLATVMGLASFMKLLSGKQEQQQIGGSTGYGGSVYGGRKNG